MPLSTTIASYNGIDLMEVLENIEQNELVFQTIFIGDLATDYFIQNKTTISRLNQAALIFINPN